MRIFFLPGYKLCLKIILKVAEDWETSFLLPYTL